MFYLLHYIMLNATEDDCGTIKFAPLKENDSLMRNNQEEKDYLLPYNKASTPAMKNLVDRTTTTCYYVYKWKGIVICTVQFLVQKSLCILCLKVSLELHCSRDGHSDTGAEHSASVIRDRPSFWEIRYLHLSLKDRKIWVINVIN